MAAPAAKKARDLEAEIAFLTRALKAPTLWESVERLAERARYPLLVDEVGYIPSEPEAANLFFQLVSGRYERASLIVTCNKPFGKAHMFARTCVRRCRNITGSAAWRDGVPARRCAAPGVRCGGMETPTWRGIRSLRTCSRPRRSLR
jgi:hypothetical protein